jgi:hypothetical protein
MLAALGLRSENWPFRGGSWSDRPTGVGKRFNEVREPYHVS